jgi:phosphopantothenoylcysteine decarboxylase
VQVVATPASLHFYSQEAVDKAVRASLVGSGVDESQLVETGDVGVKVWKDADEWSVSCERW